MLGSRAIYHDGWKAVTYHPVGPIYDDGLRSNAPWDDDVWELYHVAEDVSESTTAPPSSPRRWPSWSSCGGRRRGATTCSRSTTGSSRSSRTSTTTGAPRTRLRYFQGGAPVPEWVAVDVRNRSHDITVTSVPDGIAPSGTLLALGLLARRVVVPCDRRPAALCAQPVREKLYEVVADTELGAGRHEVAFRFEKDELLGGRAALVGRTVVGRGVERFTPVAFNEV